MVFCSSKGEPPGFEVTTAACQDGKDNDGDGEIDCADPDCKSLVACNPPPKPGACDCNDNRECTTDTCDPATGACSHTIKPTSCLIGNSCYGAGEKNFTACQVCDPTASKTSWTPIVGGCSIGGLCYRAGERSPDGCYVCDPKRSATAWSILLNPACTVGGRCYLDGERNPTGCLVCQAAVSKTTLQNAPYDCQIGGTCYTQGTAHPSPTCSSVTCNPAVSGSAWTVAGDECLVGGTCYPSGSRSLDGCGACVPTQSKTSWTSQAYACTILGACYQQGEKHPSPTCTSVLCDGAKSTSSWTVSGSECLITGSCRQAGDKTSSGCQECNPTLSKTTWSSVTGGCSIGGACYPNGATYPSDGCGSVTCDQSQSTTSWTIGNQCLIGGACFASGALDSSGCRACIPAASKTDYSPLPTSCTISGTCYKGGALHPSSTCAAYNVTCDATSSTNAWTVGGNACLIGSVCYANGATNPSNACLKCDTTASKTAWTPVASSCTIAGVCYPDGAADATGCYKCDATTSTSQWAAQTTCPKILMSALNEGRQGNLGGISGADTLCNTQAAEMGYSGTWKAFLSSSTQNAKDLITGTNATSLPVVNLKGLQMWASWSAAFPTSLSYSQWAYSTSYYLQSFAGKQVYSGTTSPNWTSGYGWTGTLTAGTVSTNTCSDWSSNTSSFSGTYGWWSSRYLSYYDSSASCASTYAVGCVRLP